MGEDTIALRGLVKDLLMNTTQILVHKDEKGTIGGYASGFFFSFQEGPDPRNAIPVLVSNRHVFENARDITIYFHRYDEEGKYLSLKSHGKIDIHDVHKICLFHPDKDVDLAIMMMAPLLNNYDIAEAKPYIKYLNESALATVERLSDFDAIVDILMVGYPQNQRDIINNIPIFRKGVTATPPAVRYNDTPYFLVDVATWSGSSGSPIVLYYPWHYNDKGKNISHGKMLLIGILSHSIYGNDDVVIGKLNDGQVEETGKFLVQSNIDLGVAVQANQLFVMKEELLKYLNNDN